MAVLLLQLSGPMQAWGSRSRFTERDTEREPTKSGVVGLLCAALGKPRHEAEGDGFPTLSELSALRLGVRADQEGQVRRDFHTAGGGSWQGGDYGVAKASGARPETVVSNRYFLADAVFLVGLEGDISLLKRLADALARPVWPLFLGRKGYPPDLPLRLPDGLRPEGDLLTLLQTYPRVRAVRARDGEIPPLRAVMDAGHGEAEETRQDIPVSFDLARRCYAVRRVRNLTVNPPAMQEAVP
jgi:CRISPR system Cascade subunit CasD